MFLYTDGFNYAKYKWPHVETDEEFELTVVQVDELDMGIISFEIPEELSRRFLTGSLLAEVKLKKDSDIPEGKPTYTTITCLNIGTVKQSLIRDINQF